MVDIQFHCDEQSNFPGRLSVSAFAYTDYSIAMHNHNFYEVNIVLSGHGTHYIENSHFSVIPGDVFVIPPMVAHAYSDTDSLEVYHILLKKSFMAQNKVESEQVRGFVELTEIEPFLRSDTSAALFLHLSPVELLQVKAELGYIDNKSAYSWEECEALKHHAVWKLLYWFSALLDKQLRLKKDRLPEKRYELYILDALGYIHTHYSEKITLDRLCRRAYMSRSTFLRAFTAVCHLSPTEYLNRYRCERARELLADGSVSKTNVAHACGFYDLSHMERMLKKQTQRTVRT